MLNKVMLIGNVGREPEVKHLDNGSMATLTLATTETWKDKQSGEKKEATEWHKVVLWGDALTKIVDRFVKKGDRIMVEGQLKTRKYNDKDGNEKYVTEVVLQGFTGRLTLLSDKPRGEAPARKEAAPEPAMELADIGDEIPF